MLTLRHSYFAHIDCVYVQEKKKLEVTSCRQDFIPLDSFLEKVPESHLISIVRSPYAAAHFTR